MYMLAGSCIWSAVNKYQNGTPKVVGRAFNIGEVWNPVCCHGNRTVKLVLWSTFSRILLQRIKHLWLKLAEIWLSLFVIVEENLVSVWRHHLDNLDIMKTWISLERKEIFEKSKQHFSSHAVYLFMFENRELKQRSFWAADVNRKCMFFLFLSLFLSFIIVIIISSIFFYVQH